MDVGSTNGWRLDDVVPAQEIVDRISADVAARAGRPHVRPATSPQRWRYTDGGGEIGIIASVTQPFCGDCTRARISAEGKLYTCLFAAGGHDLRELLRSGVNDDPAGREHPRHLDAAHRSLLRPPHRRDDLAAEGRDVAHRRLATGPKPWRIGARHQSDTESSPCRIRARHQNDTQPTPVVFVPGTNTTPSLRLVVFVPGTNTTAQATSRDSLRERCAKGARTVPDLVCPRREACRGDRFGAWHRICPRERSCAGSGPVRRVPRAAGHGRLASRGRGAASRAGRARCRAGCRAASRAGFDATGPNAPPLMLNSPEHRLHVADGRDDRGGAAGEHLGDACRPRCRAATRPS